MEYDRLVLDEIPRIHRQLMELLRLELRAAGFEDINNMEAIILLNLEDRPITVGDLTLRGYFLPSNVTYNLKKLGENGYVETKKSAHDRRNVMVTLTPKGVEAKRRIMDIFGAHPGSNDPQFPDNAPVTEAARALDRIADFWTRRISRIARGG